MTRWLGLAALLAVVACEPNVPGIYHTLATESRRANRNLHNDLTVGGTAAVKGRYYVAAHGLWSRAADRGSWQAVGRPRSGSTDQPVLGMAQSGDTLCVGTKDGVYHAEADPDTPRWQRAAGISGQILRIFAIPRSEDEILAITANAGLYVSRDDCATFERVDLPEDATATGRPFDAFHDGGSYWITVGNGVYYGERLGELTRLEEAAEGAAYRGIWCVGQDQCYFANHQGEIYEWSNDNWARLKKIDSPNDDEPDVPLTLFIQIGDQVLVGTRGYGFYQFSENDRDPDNIRRGPRSTSQLYRAHITVFARHGNLVFAGTAGHGLSSITEAAALQDTGTWDWE